MNLTNSMFLERGNPELQDRVEILRFENRTVFVVAEGAGGISGGAQPADLFVRSVRDVATELANAEVSGQLLRSLDQKIAKVPLAQENCIKHAAPPGPKGCGAPP